MSSFEFADCPTSLPLAPAARAGKVIQTGTLLLTLRNRTNRAVAGRLSVRPDAGSRPAWFGIDGAPPTRPDERDINLDPNATVSVKVSVMVPPDAPVGSHIFVVRVAAENDPDNDFAESPSVAFVVTPTAAPAASPRQKFPWWAVAVAAALVTVLGGGAIWWTLRKSRSPEPPAVRAAPDVRSLMVDAATRKLQQAGYGTTVRFWDSKAKPLRNRVIDQSTAADEKQVELVLDPGTGIPPDVRNQELASARATLLKAGYEVKDRLGDRTGKAANIVTDERAIDATQVELVLDPGPPIRSVLGKTLPEAKAALRADGYIVDYFYATRAESPQRQFSVVLRQTLDPGAKQVTLTLDPGPPYMVNKDLIGRDYNQVHNIADAQGCRQRCEQDGGDCAAYTYLNRICYLKSSVPDIHDNPGATTGVRR